MSKKDNKSVIEYKETLKYNAWVRLYLDPDSDSFGNATQSVISAYKLDKDTQYDSASVMGCENLVKLKKRSALILDGMGFGFKELMEIGLKKMKKEGYDTWERFMKRLGYFEDDPVVPTLNQFNFNLGDQIAKDREARGLPVEEKK